MLSTYLRKPDGKSIVYIWSGPDIDRSLLMAAQTAAIQKDLPLAVIRCVETDVNSEMLKKAEADLQQYNIPLMVIIGGAEKLPGVFYHVRPAKVFYDKKPENISNDFVEQAISETQLHKQLLVHPYPWPGKIIAVDELEAMGFAGC